MDLGFYFSLFLRRLHWFLFFLIIGSAIGITLAKVLPPRYVAEARLLVESEQIPDELAASTVRTEASEQLEIIEQRILARDVLVDIANRLDIYADPDEAQRALDADRLVRDMRQRINIVRTGGTQRRGVVRATLVSVSFAAPNARLSATVTNDLVTLILREDVRMRTRVARQTLEFFEQEVARLDGELAERAAVILEFKEANKDALPDSLEFRRSQQASLQERLLQLSREESALTDRKNRMIQLQETLGDSLAVAAQQDQGPQTPEARQLQQLRQELNAQLALLSPENPRIKLLQSRVAALEAVVSNQAAVNTPLQQSPGAGLQASPFDLQMAEIDGQLEFLADQQIQVNRRLDALQASIDATPGNTITLDTLERDYANVRAQYDQAVANQARAETGDIIEALSKGQRISIVEQAVIPSEPESPNRPLVAAAGVFGGAGLGLVVVVLLELLKKGIRRPVDITNKLGITPFATLPYYRTRGELWKRRVIIISILGVLLIGFPGLLWYVQTQVMPLNLLIDQVIDQISLAPLSDIPGPRIG